MKLWSCPGCSKQFALTGQRHFCHRVSLEHHFRDRPRAREIFKTFLAAVEKEGGPFRLSITKSRIGLITRITFTAAMPRKTYLRAHLLPYWVHMFEMHGKTDLDGELRSWLQESYTLGSVIDNNTEII